MTAYRIVVEYASGLRQIQGIMEFPNGTAQLVPFEHEGKTYTPVKVDTRYVQYREMVPPSDSAA